MDKPIQHQAVKSAEQTLSPKVIAGTAAGIIATVVVGALDGVTPELLEPLGAWASVVRGAIVAASASLAAYVVRDPLRRAVEHPPQNRD